MSRPIDTRETPWKTVILLCGKCSRKSGGGFGPKGKATLRTALNEELRKRGHKRDVRVVETKCFGICPKKAVVTLNASTPDRLLTVPRGTAADEILRELLVSAFTRT